MTIKRNKAERFVYARKLKGMTYGQTYDLLREKFFGDIYANKHLPKEYLDALDKEFKMNDV